MTEIKILSKDELGFVFDLVDPLDWGYFPRDFERLIELDPEGAFVAVHQNRRAGFVMTTSYGRYSFVGPMVVMESLRGQGIGEKLLVRAIDYLRSNRVEAIELDAVFKAASLYRRLGFRDKYFSYRMRNRVDTAGEAPEVLSAKMTDELIEFDYKMTRIDRSRQIRQFISEYPDSIYVTGRNRIEAWTLVRKRKGGLTWIGPLIASSTDSAIELFRQVTTHYAGEPLGLGVVEPARDFIEYLRKLGFIHKVPGLRMYHGPRLDYERNMYAIIGPEKG
jgi:GNAT superfamily N-acetyltransferase